MAADVLAQVTLSKKARYILVLSDLFMKYNRTVALPDKAGASVVHAINDEWILKFGSPNIIHIDQKSKFKSKLLKDFCHIFLNEKIRTTPYHTQANGPVERFNGVLADRLSKYCADKPQEGSLYLP